MSHSGDEVPFAYFDVCVGDGAVDDALERLLDLAGHAAAESPGSLEAVFTGDGVVLYPRQPRAAQLQRLAAGLVAREAGTRPVLRGALHAGALRTALGRTLPRGVSIAAALTALGGPGSLFASEAFERAVSPGRHTDKLDEIVVAGEPIRYRLLAAGDASPLLLDRLAVLAEANRRIEQELTLVLRTFSELPPRIDPALDEDGLGVRVTLWRRRGRALAPLAPRVARRREDTQPSTMSWWIDPPEGPIGRCVATRVPQLLLNLPDPQAEPVAYLGAWEREGVSADRVRQFSRHSRSIIAIPITFGACQVFDSVLCVDLQPPIEHLRADLERIATQLLAIQAPALAALIALRGS